MCGVHLAAAVKSLFAVSRADEGSRPTQAERQRQIGGRACPSEMTRRRESPARSEELSTQGEEALKEGIS
jgi:hypothetical protein